MSQAMMPARSVKSLRPSGRVSAVCEEEASPFGLQGLMRRKIQILKPEAMERLAVQLALRGTPEQIQDVDFVGRILARHPEWSDEYQVVHLIEKSLWIQGHCDLVMTMTKNPTQILDYPPPKILETLSEAYATHPHATIWYCVPLFGEEKTAAGLPIPVTAEAVAAEAQRRIAVAQEHAVRWRWFFKLCQSINRIPQRCKSAGRAMKESVSGHYQTLREYIRRSRIDARRRARALMTAELEYCRYGCSFTEVPEHRTWFGRWFESACLIFELLTFSFHVSTVTQSSLDPVAESLAAAWLVPLAFLPSTLMLCDPFLFVELPQDPGKLRHIAHWYWQPQESGLQKLHLHL